MEKSEMMKRYEAETGKEAIDYLTEYPFDDYTRWLEAKANISDEAIEAFQEIIRTQCDEISALKEKAEAYDRLMSGGRKTLKEWANIFGMNMAVDEKGDGIVSKYPLEFRPLYDGYKVAGYWTIRAGYPYTMFNIPFYIIDFSGSWKNSLTLPDGWEE